MASTVARSYRSLVPPTDPIGLKLTAAASAIDGIATVTKIGAESIESEGATEKLSLAELKDQIAEDLRSLDKPILVVLDDIDRLSKEEIRLTLQLVKANADFPNIIYLLLAQKDILVRALDDVAPSNAHAYLEKIVQVSFDMPVVNRKQLQDLLVKGLNELLAEPMLEERFSNKYWASLFPEIFPMFRNLRDLNRFLGALAFHIHLFRNGDTFEVNPVDLIALEAIRLFEPAVYRRISEEKEVLTAQPRWMKDKDDEGDKERIETIINQSAPERRETIRKIIGEMFPPSNVTKGIRYQGRDIEDSWFKQLRVCSHQAFERYFQLCTPQGDVSQADIDELVRSMANTEELDKVFARLVERDLLDVMLTRLSSLKETLPTANATSFLISLFGIEPPKRIYGFLESSPKEQVIRITYWYLQRLSQEDRLSVMQKALSATRGIGFGVATVSTLITKPEEQSSTLPFFKTQESRDSLCATCHAAIVAAAAEGSNIKPEEILSALSYWSKCDKQSSTSWLEAYLQSWRSLLSYLESIISISEGTGGTKQFIAVQSFEHTVSVENLESKITQYFPSIPTERESQLVRLFEAGVKRWRDGNENNPFVIENGSEPL